MRTWQSGTRSGKLLDTCPNDLITVRLAHQSGIAETTREGYLPHLVFVPAFKGRDARPNEYGGESPPTGDPIEFRVNLEPFWCPYRGEIYLDGGGASALYEVTYERTRSVPRPREEPVITRHGVTTVPQKISRGVFAVSAGATVSTAAFTHAGTPFVLTIAPGIRVPLGCLAQGAVAATSGVIESLHFHVRL